jgi:glycosyltransferase involved in cell wall biosynthesis
MNILFLHSSSDLYGGSKILIAVTSLCKQRSHTVTVVLSEPGLLSDKLQVLGIEVIFTDLGILRRKYMNVPGMFNRAGAMLTAYHRIKQICREKQIDVLYSNTTGVIIGTFLARSLRIPHFWHVHEIIEKPVPLFRLIARLLNRRNNRVIAVSNAVKDHWSRYVDTDRITVLYNGVDHWLFEDPETTLRNELRISSDAVVLGMMGRVHFWKGQDYFMRIAGILHREFPDLFFVSVGDVFPGYEYLFDKLDTIIREEGLEAVILTYTAAMKLL